MNRDLVAYRLERASETLSDAEALASQERNRSAVNRMYYALFCAASALVETQGHATSKHSGVRSLLNREFVKAGKVSSEAGAFYGEIFGHRQRGDYVDYVEFTKDETQALLAQTRTCLDELRAVAVHALEGGGQ